MRRILLCVAVVALLGACGGKSDKKTVAQNQAAPTTASTTAGADASSATSAPGAAPATTAATSPGAKPATSAAPAGTTGATPATTAAKPATGPAAGSPSAGGTASASGAPTMTRVPAGRYHYAVTGTTSFGTPPPGADLAVDAPQGSSQHSRLTVQGQSGDSTTDTTLDTQADGAHLVDLTTVTAGMTVAFHPQPSPRIQPQPMQAGATVGPFDMASTDGKTIATVKVTLQAIDEVVAVGDGSTAKTARVQLDTTIRCADGQQCAFTGTTSSTRWIRYDGLTLKDHSVTDGSYRSGFGAVPVKSDTTSMLDKQTPV